MASLDLNSVIIGGNLTADPETTTLPSGSTVTKFRIACNGGKDKDGNEYPTTYTDVKVWNGQGQNCQKYLSKGRGVTVKGRLTYEEWEARDGSGKRSRHLVTADRFGGVFFGSIPQGRSQEPSAADVAQANDLSPNVVEGDDDIPF